MYDQSSPYDNSQSVLNDLDHLTAPEHATTGQRFANFILDRIFLIIFVLVCSAIYGAFLGLTGNISAINRIAEANQNPGMRMITNYLWGAVASLFYYTLSEGLMGGRTLGKLITGTRAVNEDDFQPITFSKAFQRSLCRIIPFNAFSALSGAPWHDTISKTTVVKTRP